MSSHRDDHGRKVPIWNGVPETFDRYKDEIRIWILGTPSGQNDFSMAARLVSHLRGPAQRIGLTLTDAELTPRAAVLARPDEEPPQAAVPAYTQRDAVDCLLDRLQATLLPTTIQRRGTYLRDFFREEKYKRRDNEPLQEWIPRWDEGVERLRRDNIDFHDVADLPGMVLP